MAVACPRESRQMSFMESRESRHPWFAVQVKGRSEKLIASLLAQKGYEEFVPTYHEKRRWSDRVKDRELPLFPSYLFCRFPVERRLPILTTPGVIRILGLGKVPIPVAESEVAAIQAIVESGWQAEPWPYLQTGQRVQITEGPLRGLEGFLVTVKNQKRLVVSVTLLRRSVTVEIDGSSVCSVAEDRALAIPA